MGSGIDFLSECTKSLPDLMLIYKQDLRKNLAQS